MKFNAEKIKIHVLKYKYLYILTIAFLLFRLINLTKPPLFNDESIYLDWGYKEINKSGFLYYSLFDAKQPFLMWMFGIMENIFLSPVFAGRLVSVIAGFLTLAGLYKLAKYVFNKKIAFLTAFLYIFIPIFSFYDRLALMEASITAIGIWSAYFLIKSIKESSLINFLLLGLILGIGYFIKSTALLFLATSVLILAFKIIKDKQKTRILIGMTILSLSFLAAVFLLIINPMFWQTLQTNTRFTLSASEILAFPLSLWINNVILNFRTSFFYITPLVFLAGILGIYFSIKIKRENTIFLSSFLFISLIIETLVVRGASDRYLVAFLPIILIYSSYFIHYIWAKNKFYGKVFFIAMLVLCLPVILLQIFNQADYFKIYGKISGVGYYDYLDTFSTGFELPALFAHIDNLSQKSPIYVGIAENIGNPESAIIVNYNKNKNVHVVYFDSRIFPAEVFNFDCINVGAPLYFVARKDELVGLDKYLILERKINNPHGSFFVNIYTLRNTCDNSKTVNITLQ